MAVPTIEALIISPSESRVLGALTAVEVNVLVMLSSSLGVRILQSSRRWGRVLSMGRWNRAVYGYGDRSSGIEDDAPCGDALITADFATDGSAGNAVTESLAPGLIRCGYAVYRAMGCVRMTASVMIVSIPDAKRRTVQLYGGSARR